MSNMQAQVPDGDQPGSPSYEADGRDGIETSDIRGTRNSGGNGAGNTTRRDAKNEANQESNHNECQNDSKKAQSTCEKEDQKVIVSHTTSFYGHTKPLHRVVERSTGQSRQVSRQSVMTKSAAREVTKYQAPFEHRPFDPEATRSRALEDREWWD